MKIEIKARFTGAVLFSHDAENNTIKLTAEAAVEAGASFAGAYLDGANLAGANLDGANLAGANLAGAYLDGASLAGANLDGAYLAGAYLDDKSKLVGARPIFQIGPIGSRYAYFVAYLTDQGLRLRAGCFFGTRAEFEARLLKDHDGSIHGKEYRAALAMIDAHAELWTPAKEVKEAA